MPVLYVRPLLLPLSSLPGVLQASKPLPHRKAPLIYLGENGIALLVLFARPLQGIPQIGGGGASGGDAGGSG